MVQEPAPTALTTAIPVVFPAAQPDAHSLLTSYQFFIILLSTHFWAVTELGAKSLCSLISTERVCWVWTVVVMRNLVYRCRGMPCVARQRAWPGPFAVPVGCTDPVGVLGSFFIYFLQFSLTRDTTVKDECRVLHFLLFPCSFSAGVNTSV